MRFYFLFLIIIIFACQSEKQNKVNATEFLAFRDQNIVGGWSICVSKCGDTIIHANQCTGFDFNTNGTGTQSRGSNIVANFFYVVKGNMVYFSFGSKKDKENFYLDEKSYRIEWSKYNNIPYMVLHSLTSDCYYY
jgi:hypothetical protein